MDFSFAAILVVAIFAGWGAYVAFRWRQTYRLADDVYAAKREQGELGGGVEASAFKAAFVRAEGPRLATYMFAAGLACLILAPAAISVFNVVWDEMWNLSGRPPVFTRGLLLHSVLTIFVYVGLFFSICGLTMLRYHRNAPPSLRSEIRRLNGDRA